MSFFFSRISLKACQSSEASSVHLKIEEGLPEQLQLADMVLHAN